MSTIFYNIFYNGKKAKLHVLHGGGRNGDEGKRLAYCADDSELKLGCGTVVLHVKKRTT